MTQPAPAAPLLDREPVRIGTGALAVLIDALIVLCDVFDWIELTNGQTAALVAFVSAASAIAADLIRSRVWSPASVAAITDPMGL